MVKKYHWSFKAIAILLCVNMLLELLPMKALAEGIHEQIVCNQQSENREESYVVKEIAENRTEYSKTYLLSNGSKSVVVSGQPLHFIENGEWQEIDNELLPETDEQGNEVLTNQSNDMSVTLPQTLEETAVVSLKRDGYTLSYRLLNSHKTEATVQNTALRMRSVPNQRQTAEEKTFSSIKNGDVLYQEIAPNTNLNYRLEAKTLKENILLKTRPREALQYQYEIFADGLRPVLNQDHSIAFYTEVDEKIPVFVMPAPYMFDNKQVASEDIEVSFVPDGDHYLLTYIPDLQWLQDAERSYPVTIDPVITAEPTNHRIMESLYSEITGLDQSDYGLEVGTVSDGNVQKALMPIIRMSDLPEIPEFSTITKATLNLTNQNNSGISTTVHQVMQEYIPNTYPLPEHIMLPDGWFDSRSTDIQLHDGDLKTWNITPIVNNWYNNPSTNFGVTLRSMEIPSPDFRYPNVQFYGVRSEYAPYFVIEYTDSRYVNSVGSERSLDVGRAGTVSVNDYTGNVMIQRQDIGYSGNILPVSIGMNYSGADRNGGSPYGAGWNVSYAQRIEYVQTDDAVYYEYTNDNGKKSRFYQKEEGFEEDDSGFTITTGTLRTDYTQVTLKDLEDRIYSFDSLGRLVSIKDSSPNQNSIDITYLSNGAIDSITDGVGRVYQFVYTDGLLHKIQYYGTGNTVLKETQYSYGVDKTVQQVVFPDGKAVDYQWNENKLPTSAADFDQHRMSLIYTPGCIKPSRLEEYYGTTLEQGIDIDRMNNQVVYSDGEGIQEILQFDYAGNLVSIQDEKGNSSYSKYSASQEGEVNKNKLIDSSGLQKTSVNLLTNGYANLEKGWSCSQDANGYSKDKSYLGSRSFQVESVSYDSDSWMEQNVSVQSGKIYTLSSYVSTSLAGDGGAKLQIHSSDADAIQVITKSLVIDGNTDWQRIYTTFQAMQDAEISIRLLVSDAVGAAYFDGVQLESGDVAGKVNLLENAGFDTDEILADEPHSPTCWNEIGSYGISVVDRRLQMRPYGYHNYSNAQQTLSLSGSAGDTYSFGAWALSYALAGGQYENGFQMSVKAVRADHVDKTEHPADVVYQLNFNTDLYGLWQSQMSEFTTEYDYCKLIVMISYDLQANDSFVDNVQLYKEPLYLMSQETEETPEEGEGEGSTEPVETRDEYGRVIEVVTQDGLKTQTQYDDNNNVLFTTVSNADNGKKLISGNQYTADGNYVSGGTNDAGNTASYDVDGDFGLIHSAVDGRGNAVSYQYNPNHLLTGVSQAVSGLFGGGTALSAQYIYNDKDQLSQISHNGFAYSMSYDPFGSLQQVKAGTQSLVSFVYNDKHQMTAQQFGNGQSISYGYNQKDQLTGVTYQNNLRYGFEYDSAGAVSAILDYQSGRKTTMQTQPDGSARTVQVGLGSQSYSHEYSNTSGEKDSSFREIIGGREFITLYAGQEGPGTDVRFTVNAQQPHSITYQESYDGLQRSSGYQLQSKQDDEVSNLLTASYQYRDLDDERTTSQISRIDLVTSQGERKSFAYQYDESGNIVQENGTDYHYDEAGQLIRVNDANANKTFVYQYDAGGNIRSKKEYAYTTENLGDAVASISYGYDSQWKDKLISYNGSAVTSDSIGNITAMDGWSYAWQMGRQLAAASKGSVSISYLYNENGIRTSKTVNGVKTEYTLVDDRITYQTDGTDSLYFRYDANNQLIGFETLSSDGTSTGYYYLKNLQGDIVGIVDGAGRVVVEYTYDAWGAPTGMTGSAAETIGQLNPFRYRGYYYDAETGMYYLQSRYYNPVVGRFLNADEQINPGIFGPNLYAYCNNNPINYSDPNGRYTSSLVLVPTLISALSSALAGIITSISATMASIKAAIVTSWIPVVCIAAVSIAIVGIIYAVRKISSLIAKSASVVSAVRTKVNAKGVDQNKLKGHSVYVIYRNDSKDVVYVGRTCNFIARRNAHKKRFPTSQYTMIPIATNLTLAQARALEQTIITAYGIDTLQNMINSVSPSKWNFFKQEFEQMRSLIDSFYDPE